MTGNLLRILMKNILLKILFCCFFRCSSTEGRYFFPLDLDSIKGDIISSAIVTIPVNSCFEICY